MLYKEVQKIKFSQMSSGLDDSAGLIRNWYKLQGIQPRSTAAAVLVTLTSGLHLKDIANYLGVVPLSFGDP